MDTGPLPLEPANKFEDRQDRRFSDAFLIVTPGITIRDRLRVLLPSDPGNYYQERDIVPVDLKERLGQARIVIANYHGFMLRERGDAARLTKTILTKGETSPFVESGPLGRQWHDSRGRRRGDGTEVVSGESLSYATQASKAGQGATAEQLEADADRQAMALWPLTVLGEAASHVSTEYRGLHPEIPWKRIVGLRNILIHD